MSSDYSCNIAIHVYYVGPRKGLFNEIFKIILSANFKCISNKITIGYFNNNQFLRKNISFTLHEKTPFIHAKRWLKGHLLWTFLHLSCIFWNFWKGIKVQILYAFWTHKIWTNGPLLYLFLLPKYNLFPSFTNKKVTFLELL